MNIGRIFANALARRVAFVVVAAVLAWFGIGQSHAQNMVAPSNCYSTGVRKWHCATQGAARAMANTPAPEVCGSAGMENWSQYMGQGPITHASTVTPRSYAGTVNCKNPNTGATSTFSGRTATYDAGTSCASFEDIQTGWAGSGTVCNNGCAYDAFEPTEQFPDGGFTNNGAMCYVGTATPAPEDKPSDRDGDGVPDDLDAFPDDADEAMDSDGDGVGDNADDLPNDPYETVDSDGDGIGDNSDQFPNNPGESVDSDGDGVGDNGDAFPNDPTETHDSDGNGVGDNAQGGGGGSGGGDGDGDGTGDGTASGGDSCSSPPVMTGDPVLAMAARQAYLIRCGSSLGDANGDGVPDYLATDGLDNDHGEAAVAGMSAWEDEAAVTPTLDESGFGLGRSCPAPPTIVLAGMSHTIDTSALCDLSAIIAALVYLIALAHAAYIFGGNR